MEESHACAQAPRFEILGPLRAWRGDLELDLGPAKQRAVLAVLLTHANKPVQTARIIEEVWGDDRPENGANVVQKYIAGLRRVLEPERPPRTPGQLLTLTNAGYLLRVEPNCLDVDQFHALVRQARTARAESNLVDASRLLGDAIGLWRAEVLANLSEPLLGTARRRLNEMRVAALEEWAEVELDLGHHSRLVPELGRLVTEFPLREQLRYLLMLALYRCGRQAEAYSAYRDARDFLVEEFGVEPSKRLQLLQERMLQTDPALEWRATGGPAEATTRPPLAPPAQPPAMAAAVEVTRAVEPPPATRDVLGQWCGRAFAVFVPIISFGLLTWAVIAYLGGRRRSVKLGLAAAGYFVLLAITMFTLMTNEESDAMRASDILGLLALFVAMLGGATQAAMVSFETPTTIATGGSTRSGRFRVGPVVVRVLAAAVPLVSFGLLTWLVVAVYAARRRSLTLSLAAIGYLGLVALIFFLYGINADSPLRPIDGVWVLMLFLTTFGGTVHVALLTSTTYRPPVPTTDPHPWLENDRGGPQQDMRTDPAARVAVPMRPT